MIAALGKTISEQINDLFQKYGKRVGTQKNIPLDAAKEKKLKKLINNPPSSLDNRKVLNIETIDGLKLDLADDDWFLLRFSGTEPLIRCYAESGSKKEAEKLMRFGLELIS